MRMSEFANWMDRNNVAFVSIAGSTSISNQFNEGRTRTHAITYTIAAYNFEMHAYVQIAVFIADSGWFIIEWTEWIELLYWTKMASTKSIARKCISVHENVKANVLRPLSQIQSPIHMAINDKLNQINDLYLFWWHFWPSRCPCVCFQFKWIMYITIINTTFNGDNEILAQHTDRIWCA